jgi:ABC-2 type transport system permease protein
VERARFLSPAILLQDALNDVSGTGVARHREFVSQVEAYHQRWRDYFVPLVFQRARLADYSRLPGFSLGEEPFEAVSGRVAISVAGISLPAFVVGAVGLTRLRRYPVLG